MAVAAVVAAADWVAVARRSKPLEYVCKPAVMVALVGVALALVPVSPAQRWWFVAALVFGCAGDVFLMLPRDRFVPGLAAFLVGHLCYVVGFLVRGVDPNVAAASRSPSCSSSSGGSPSACCGRCDPAGSSSRRWPPTWS